MQRILKPGNNTYILNVFAKTLCTTAGCRYIISALVNYQRKLTEYKLSPLAKTFTSGSCYKCYSNHNKKLCYGNLTILHASTLGFSIANFSLKKQQDFQIKHGEMWPLPSLFTGVVI